MYVCSILLKFALTADEETMNFLMTMFSFLQNESSITVVVPNDRGFAFSVGQNIEYS